jgi:hypothetical protein
MTEGDITIMTIARKFSFLSTKQIFTVFSLKKLRDTTCAIVSGRLNTLQ